jgi:predicted nucleic acid-binding protein
LKEGNGDAVISTQVMMEYCNIAVKNLKLEPAFAAQRLRLFAKFRTVSTTHQLVIAATDLLRLHSVSFWDAMNPASRHNQRLQYALQ